MKMSPSPDTLHEAHLRIAALERELAQLRAATPSPTPPPQSSRPLQPRPSIMTRRAAAAAAAAAAVVAVATDLTNPRPSHTPVRLAPKPPSPPPSRSASALSNSPPECSEVSRGASELSESQPAPPSPPVSSEPSECLSPSPLALQTSADQVTVKMDGNQKAPTVLFETLTPDLGRPVPPAAVKPVSRESRHFLSAPLPVVRPKLKEADNTPKLQEAKRAGGARRRPPPLPVVKTASTKKERHNIIATCTEPKPGQTRYWTEEEHDRFLEAVAEYGEKAYVAISNYVETRTPKQVRTHAQKFQMKMARLARQSIDAGEPVQIPAGMSPVVQMHTDGKATLVQLHVSGQSTDLCANMANGLPGHVPVVTVPPSRAMQPKKRNTAKANSAKNSKSLPKVETRPGKVTQVTEKTKPVDALAKVSSTMTEESSSALTDPYIDYISGASDSKVDMELEHTFAAKLCQTLQGTATDNERVTKEGEFLMSDGASNDSGSSGDDDDDLADLENLEDGDLSLAPFTNASECWLLPDSV